MNNLSSDLTLLKSSLNSVKQKQSQTIIQARYEFKFVSLISPGWAPNSGVKSSDPRTISDTEDNFINHFSKQTFKRTLLKRSYLLISWFYYLESSNKNVIKYSKSSTAPAIKLAILPSTRKMYTLTKAPMAHKTNSKEQFMFKFYFFKFSTYVRIDYSQLVEGVNQGGYAMSWVLKNFPFYETNLLFLKYYKIIYPITINSYLTCLV